MNYRQQETFLNQYAQVGVGMIALNLVFFGVLVNVTRRLLSWGDITKLTLLAIALSVAVFYVPKYLFLTIEEHKKYSWTIRIRWILGGLFLLSTPLVGRSFKDYGLMVGAAGFVLSTNWAVREVFRQVQRKQKKPELLAYIPFVYAAGDSLGLGLLLSNKVLTLETGVLLTAMAVHLLILLLSQKQLALIPVIVIGVAGLLWFVGGQGPHIGSVTSWMIVSLALCWMARDRHRKNLEEMLFSLVDFTGETPEHIQEALLTSTGALAANWNANPPTTPEELETWYRQNSGYYIYDLAQFHLAYKHIVFTLDVISQSRGRVLDYGAGIGDLSLELAARGDRDVTYFDVDGETQQFARWRARERKLRVNFASDRRRLESQYDTIILLDVLEHLADPIETLEFLVNRLAPGGKLVASIAFGPTKAHPMHFDHDFDAKTWLRERGFFDAKTVSLRLFGSEAMRRSGVIIYQKKWTPQ